MIALASVDLQESLGPISALNSRSRTCRSTPLRICLSPAATWRFRISRSAMDLQWGAGEGSRGGSGAGELDQLGQGGALQRADDAHLHARPQELGGAVLVIAVAMG